MKRSKEQTQSRLLEAALELFSEKGYDAVSVQTIVEAAGVGHGTVFWHFGSKEALYIEVATRAGARFWEFVEPIVDRADSPDSMLALALAHHQFLHENPKLDLLQMSLVFESCGPHPELLPALEAVNSKVHKAWSTWVNRMDERGFLLDDVDRRELVHTLTAGFGAIAVTGIVHRGRDMTPSVRELVKILSRGVFKPS